MARAEWLLKDDRPTIEIVLTQAMDGKPVVRTLLADTGAGNTEAPFELLLEESDCLMCGGKPTHAVVLGGAYSGSYPLYTVRVQIPQLSFDSNVAVVGVSTTPQALMASRASDF
jgi:hypothetical protein